MSTDWGLFLMISRTCTSAAVLINTPRRFVGSNQKHCHLQSADFIIEKKSILYMNEGARYKQGGVIIPHSHKQSNQAKEGIKCGKTALLKDFNSERSGFFFLHKAATCGRRSEHHFNAGLGSSASSGRRGRAAQSRRLLDQLSPARQHRGNLSRS